MKLAVRGIGSGDAAAVALLEKSANASVRSPEQLERLCRGGPQTFEQALVAEFASDVVGVVIYSRVLDELSIHDIIIDSARRGEGCGGQLLRELLLVARSQGVKRILLEVRASNSAAIALYRSSGFRVDGIRPSYYPAPQAREDAVLMSLEW